MDVIFFETWVVERTSKGDVLIALFDGSHDDPTVRQGCVAILLCQKDTGEMFGAAVRETALFRYDQS